MSFNYDNIKQKGSDILQRRYSDLDAKRNDIKLWYMESLAECHLYFEEDKYFAEIERIYNEFSEKINNFIRVYNSNARNPFSIIDPTIGAPIIQADKTCNRLISSIICCINEIKSRCKPKQLYIPELDAVLKIITNKSELDYLTEAANCLKNGYIKASIVLGWCATINRIHLKIEQIGFSNFNTASTKMKNASGIYKQFNKEFSISSLSEMREVFDNDVLWIIEYMGLIDSNQRKRLKVCFDMRCQAAHPGDAPFKQPNAIAFFSDIIEIVLSNQKFII